MMSNSVNLKKTFTYEDVNDLRGEVISQLGTVFERVTSRQG